MRSFKYIIFYSGLLLFITLNSCKRKDGLKVKAITSTYDVTGQADNRSEEISYPSCKDPLDYVPYPEDLDYFEKRTIKISFHLMSNTKKNQNFKEGTGDAENYLPKLVENANMRLRENFKMNLPEGNDTPNLDPYYQYVITGQDDNDDGIYYHYDDELYFYLNKGRGKNNYRKDAITKYGIDTENILNVFLIPHHPDSIKSKTYKEKDAGIALGTAIKMGCEWQNPKRHWRYATLLNHEIGHVMSLRHAWIARDGCDDTPVNKNCFSNTGKKPCDGVISNNLMDYNASQMAITPCQIGRVHKVIGDINSRQRPLVIPTWCNYISDRPIRIKTNIEWNGSKDINRDIIVEKGGSLTINCRLSMAAGAKITVEPGGILNLNNSVLHNACGDEWGGIELIQGKKSNGVISHTGNVQILDAGGKPPNEGKLKKEEKSTEKGGKFKL